jgi:hypothetical protein
MQCPGRRADRRRNKYRSQGKLSPTFRGSCFLVNKLLSRLPVSHSKHVYTTDVPGFTLFIDPMTHPAEDTAIPDSKHLLGLELCGERTENFFPMGSDGVLTFHAFAVWRMELSAAVGYTTGHVGSV